jgi:hypothetical protein
MAGFTVDVRHDLAKLQADLGLYAKETMAAAVRALNRTMGTVRKEAAHELASDYAGIKIGALKARMKLLRATQKSARAAVEFSGRRFPLYGNFAMHASGRWGVKFGRLPWRIETISGDTVTPEMLARAFRNRARASGRASVFARHTAARLSFEVLVAPGLARALEERAIGDALIRVGHARFSVVFEQEAKFRLSKRS